MKEVIKIIIYNYMPEIVAGILIGTTVPICVLAIWSAIMGIPIESMMDMIIDRIIEHIHGLMERLRRRK